MSDIQSHQTRRQHVTREEEADRCLNHTEFTKGSQLIVTLLFLFIVFGVPAAQHVVEIRENLKLRASWSPASGDPQPSLAPQVYDVFGLLPTSNEIKEARGFWGYWSLIPSGESISTFESSLKENSVLTKSLLSPAQAIMSSTLGVGNEKAYIGKAGWLFYRPDVEYVTSDGFLDPARLKLRAHGTSAIQPDPVLAIVDFKNQLAKRGIQLIVMPMTTKPMIHSEFLASTHSDKTPLQNPAFDKFKSELDRQGVLLFDPTPVLSEARTTTLLPQFLTADTHWTPNGMETVARALSRFLSAHSELAPVKSPGYLMQTLRISGQGDIAEMLKLPQGQTIFPKQEVALERVVNPDLSPWEVDSSSDILLLGDSFTNIYSLDSMGWGNSAGFAEHLSYDLGRPLDKIAINAGGSFASRRALAQQLASGRDRLAGKKVVVYEFSMRDLTEGDWKMIHLKDLPPVFHPKIEPSQPVKAVTPKPPIAMPSMTPLASKKLPKEPIHAVTTGPKPSGKPSTNTKPATIPVSSASKAPGAGGTKPTIKPLASNDLLVTGRIAARASTPKPGSVPYKDCLIALQLTDLKVNSGSVKGPNIIVYVWGLKDNQLVDGRYSVGQSITFKLSTWSSVESKYGGLNRQELESDEALSWAAFWGEIK